MGKLWLPLLFAIGVTAAGGVSAGAAATTSSGTSSTGTATAAPTPEPTPGTTPEPTPATTPEPTPTAEPVAPPPRRPAVIAEGVTIADVAVGGLARAPATAKVRAAFARRLVLVVERRRFRVSPRRLGTVAYVRTAVARALLAPPGARVRLKVAVRGRKTRSYVTSLARRVDRAPVDSVVLLRHLRPFLTEARPGRRLDRPRAVKLIVRTLVANRRGPLRLKVKRVAPAVGPSSYGPVIVIRRESKRLYLYDGMRLWRVFAIATGQPAYPTPLGRFSIAVMWRNPWWYPPDSSWARGAKPVPPGPGNPLGTRWMGLTAPGVGIHGTPDAASIGYSASHGCIRMRIADAEWLFGRVRIGTIVFIVGA